MKVLGRLICIDNECAERCGEVWHTEELSIPLPDGQKIITQEAGKPFHISLALREVWSIENNIATLSCGHRRYVPILKLSAQEWLVWESIKGGEHCATK